MSVSGVGNGNSLFPNWASLNKVRGEAATQKASGPVSGLGQEISLSGQSQSAVQSVTGASGGQMNHHDSGSFGQSMATLTQALDTGDAVAAKEAFAKAKELVHSAGVHGHRHHHGGAKAAGAADPGAATGATDPFASAFASIGQSLQSGDLAGAQSALTQLDALLQGAARKLTQPPVGANGPANPAGGAIDLTA